MLKQNTKKTSNKPEDINGQIATECISMEINALPLNIELIARIHFSILFRTTYSVGYAYGGIAHSGNSKDSIDLWDWIYNTCKLHLSCVCKAYTYDVVVYPGNSEDNI